MNSAHQKAPGFRPTTAGTPGGITHSWVNLRVLLEKIYRVRKQGDQYYSPVRDDGQNAAFSVREDGEVGIDHGTRRGFNALILIQEVEKLNPAEAKERLAFYARNSEVFTGECSAQYQPIRTGHRTPSGELCQNQWNYLSIGTHSDYLKFAKLRGLSVEALITATALDLFFFLHGKENQRLCTVTDNARYVRQDRCIDGSEVIRADGGKAKNRTIGSASWPVGAANIGDRRAVLLVEGLPDLLAAVQVIGEADRHRHVAAVSMLGAGQSIHQSALPLFTGKRVRIIPDEDDAGLQAAQQWTQQLQSAGATVETHRLCQITTKSGIKDLNDLLVQCCGQYDPATLVPDIIN